MRLPYTHQSALTYPLPPPSTILGMLANALQRAEARPPLECLDEVEEHISTSAAVADASMPIVARSCVVSLIIDMKDRKTNALPRQFAHTLSVRILAFSENHDFLLRTSAALGQAPITLGGSESLAAIVDREVADVEVVQLQPGEDVTTLAYAPQAIFDETSLEGRHSQFWVHESCRDADALLPYLFPMTLEGCQYQPAELHGTVASEGVTEFRCGDDRVLVLE